MQSVELVTNKKHLVTQIMLGFSGALNAAEAAHHRDVRVDRGRASQGSFTADEEAVSRSSRPLIRAMR